MTVETMANGIRFTRFESSDSGLAREFIAEFERGGPAAIKYVSNYGLADVKVRLDDSARDADGGGVEFDVPDGWAVAKIRVGCNGSTILGIDKEGDR